MKKLRFMLTFLCFLFLLVHSSLGSDVKQAESVDPSPRYDVENLEAVLHDAGLFQVTGNIRNTDTYPTKGYVIIYFANDNDEVIAVAETIVNEKKAIDPGSTGPFELSRKIEKYRQISKTFIEYVVQEKIILPKKPLITIGSKR